MTVVVGVRDLARTLPSAWQQAVVMGATTTWQEYVGGVLGESGSVRAAASFRLRHDVLRVLDVWGRWVPPERLHLVTVPPPGASPEVLLQRFAAAAGLPPEAWHAGVPSRNDGLGAAEVELVRRLNEALGGRLAPALRRHVVEQGIRPRWDVPASRPLVLPAGDRARVRRRSEALVAELRERGHPVFGDLDDLLPRPDEPGEAQRPPRVDRVSDAELLAAAESAMVALAVAHGRLYRRHRRASESDGQPVSWRAQVDSESRAVLFALQRETLVLADRHRLLGAGVRAVLRRR